MCPLVVHLGFRFPRQADLLHERRTTYAEQFGCSLDDLELLSLNGMKSAFAPYEERCRLIFEGIKEPATRLRTELGLPERHQYGHR